MPSLEPFERQKRASGYRTDFRYETEGHFFVAPTRVATASEGTRLKHQQAASIKRLTSGELLIACRWDETGDSEGDATNEQALYVSRDEGRSWQMTNGGEPIITLANGTSFGAPSAITHSFVFEDATGAVWMYYTINQPYTWGKDQPDRATGGGEIRRVLLSIDEAGEWTAGASQVVWAFRRPIDDGAGGVHTNVRVLCLNGIVRLRSGRLLMPIAGRATVDDPEGTFWPLNRVWVLASDDGGASWASHFVGGGPSLAVCEPTIVESGADDHVVAYMRSQYDTGFELYRSESGDGGLTWTKPSAAGLPNTSGSGCKPYIVGLRAGGYAMLLTNEHDITDRTNVSLFMTDEAGLRANEWRLVKTVSAECREHWLGAAYGWLADDPSGDVLATWVSYTATLNHLNFARLNADWLASTVIEPLGPNDQLGDDLPRVITGPECSGLLFPALRSRAHAPHLPSYQGRPYRLELRFSIEQLSGEFPVLDLRSCHGRHAWLKLELRGSQPEISPDGARNNDPKNANPVAADRASRLELWLHANSGGAKTQVRVGNDLELTVDVLNCTEARLVVDGTDLGVVRSASANPPATLYIGGNAAGVGACKVLLTEASYALLGDGGNAGEASS